MGPKQTVQSQPAARDAVHALQIDTELSPEVADHFNIPKLPTLILFKGSQQARQAAVCAAPAHATPGRRSRHARGHAFTGISAAPQVAEGPKKNGAGLLFIT